MQVWSCTNLQVKVAAYFFNGGGQIWIHVAYCTIDMDRSSIRFNLFEWLWTRLVRNALIGFQDFLRTLRWLLWKQPILLSLAKPYCGTHSYPAGALRVVLHEPKKARMRPKRGQTPGMLSIGPRRTMRRCGSAICGRNFADPIKSHEKYTKVVSFQQKNL